jgi:hypothetical protein
MQLHAVCHGKPTRCCCCCCCCRSPAPLEIEPGQTVTLTTRADAEATDTVLPVTYPQLHNMCEAGGEHGGGRGLAAGAVRLRAAHLVNQQCGCAPHTWSTSNAA